MVVDGNLVGEVLYDVVNVGVDVIIIFGGIGILFIDIMFEYMVVVLDYVIFGLVDVICCFGLFKVLILVLLCGVCGVVGWILIINLLGLFGGVCDGFGVFVDVLDYVFE